MSKKRKIMATIIFASLTLLVFPLFFLVTNSTQKEAVDKQLESSARVFLQDSTGLWTSDNFKERDKEHNLVRSSACWKAESSLSSELSNAKHCDFMPLAQEHPMYATSLVRTRMVSATLNTTHQTSTDVTFVYSVQLEQERILPERTDSQSTGETYTKHAEIVIAPVEITVDRETYHIIKHNLGPRLKNLSVFWNGQDVIEMVEEKGKN